MTKKRIDFYCATFLTGGIETTLIQILRKLDRSKFRIRLIILYHTVGQETLLTTVPNDVEVKYVVGSKFLNKLRSKRLQGRLPLYLKFIEEIFLVNFRRVVFYNSIRSIIKDCDIVVDYGMCLMKWPGLFFNVRKMIYCHFSLNHLNRFNSKKNLELVKSLNTYDKVITIADEMRDQFEGFYPNEKNKTVRIYNYIDQEHVIKRSLEGEEVSIDQQPYILSIGRLDQSQKDYLTLLKAYAIAREKYAVNMRLIILGKGRDLQRYSELCRELAIENHVDFRGFEENPFCWIKNASLFVHASFFEGLPTVVVEALVLGKKIVATQCETGVKELLANGKAGYLCIVGDENELALKIAEALNNDASNQRILDESQKVLKNFSMDQTVGKLEQVLLS
ncbi:glycosyltransferase [Carboxylicivirga sp. N1Y90]|uniref:glycosyltransferase n=1 Tax=Carboxylicivirga fragile TaxID=3417571 RepID=UPI003D34081F|nr:glycosyltransferase [Marinilabiliaceae bacterium N1Y90]